MNAKSLFLWILTIFGLLTSFVLVSPALSEKSDAHRPTIEKHVVKPNRPTGLKLIIKTAQRIEGSYIRGKTGIRFVLTGNPKKGSGSMRILTLNNKPTYSLVY